MLLQKNIVKKYLALLPDEQTQEAWKWVREPSLDPFSDVKAFLLKSKGIANPLIIQSLEKTRGNEMLISALSFGAGIRQLSRLTGVSFGVIQKLQK